MVSSCRPTQESDPMLMAGRELTEAAEAYYPSPSGREILQKLLYEASQSHCYSAYFPPTPYGPRPFQRPPAMIAFVGFDHPQFSAWPYFSVIPKAAPAVHPLFQGPYSNVDASDFSGSRKSTMIEELPVETCFPVEGCPFSGGDERSGFNGGGRRGRQHGQCGDLARKDIPRTDGIFNKKGHCKGKCGELVWRRKFNSFPIGECTSLMIRNIPNRVSRRELTDLLDEHCREENEGAESWSDRARSEFDFLYLPIDFVTELNYGYAFVNFTTIEAASRFCKSWVGQTWDKCGYNSKKICEITGASIQVFFILILVSSSSFSQHPVGFFSNDMVSECLQGKENLKKHFQRSVFFCKTDDFLPVELSPPSDGLRLTQSMFIGTRREPPVVQQ
ncbi:hypothetical protein Nepgr_023669 [Nepenthes gracilis]|uniref:RRM domain-containing protein n=1 Tax=Nepenthes gracilis TaxID=150966 RepID=A0AAD3XZN5_NEPGR|nr:hypothetical protein Nepgr_023669 [Nepenthes gracilis]